MDSIMTTADVLPIVRQMAYVQPEEMTGVQLLHVEILPHVQIVLQDVCLLVVM